MPASLVLYPAYGTVSCHEVSRYVAGIDGLRLVLADDLPTASDMDIFDEVMELPPLEQLAEPYQLV